jgi:catechol 2,3-dioxygenase-like lactoylglutathione lyase family enzyme
MLDHFGFVVRDLAVSRRFYEAALKPLGLTVIQEQPTAFIVARSQTDRIPFIYIGAGRPSFWTPESQAGRSPVHYGFAANDRASVDAFYNAGLAAGGRDNGAPGLRREGYYAAYLLDPDNNNIEAGYRE